MKIYTKVVIDMTTNEVVESDSFEYEGPVAQCFNVGGGGSSEYSKPVKLGLWNPAQKKLWSKNLYPYLKDKLDKPSTSYPRELFVPRTKEEDTYFASDYGYSPEFASKLASDLAERKASMRDSLSKAAFEINPEITKQFFEQSVKNPMMQEYREIVDPGIKEAFAGPGYWGSARAQAQQQGAEHLATTLGSQYGQLMYADEQARRESLEAAKEREAGFAGIDVQSELAAMQAQLDQEKWGKEFAEEAGRSRAELSREIAQEEAMAGLQRWLMGEEVDGEFAGQYNPYTQMIFQALGLSPFGYGQESKGSSTDVSFGFMS